MDKDTFCTVYGQFFPPGGKHLSPNENELISQATKDYAEMVFRTFDKQKTGALEFENFVLNLSDLSRGSVEKKLEFIFALYDANEDGQISLEEIASVTRAVFGLVGPYSKRLKDDLPASISENINQKAASVLKKFDLDQDGVISRQEFFEVFQQDPELMKYLYFFDTYI
ncbi:hypothetical protein Ciccas_008560 [Cichlidogyrus casuarinus]|uniref:EF-hand domain-containing protein n=1 Tax=Cichlidogyrus casuarinus TaxID=1844966 RepID=A0ABD2PZQ8_9PLAT